MGMGGGWLRLSLQLLVVIYMGGGGDEPIKYTEFNIFINKVSNFYFLGFRLSVSALHSLINQLNYVQNKHIV